MSGVNVSVSSNNLRLTATATGVSDIVHKFKYMASQLSDGLQAAAFAGAVEFEQEAKAIVPVRTGRLQRSIHIEMADVSSRSATAVVGPDDEIDYAVYVELGTRKQQAHPFMRPAYDNRREAAAAAVIDVLIQEVNAVLSLRGAT